MTKRNINKRKVTSRRRALYVLVVLPLLIILSLITYKLSNQVYKQKQIDKEIGQLEKEIENLNQENNDLSELIGYLETDNFKEKEAKDKLNLIKEGEQLVLVKENDPQRQEKIESDMPEVVVNRPNYYWWWQYFFGVEKNY